MALFNTHADAHAYTHTHTHVGGFPQVLHVQFRQQVRLSKIAIGNAGMLVFVWVVGRSCMNSVKCGLLAKDQICTHKHTNLQSNPDASGVRTLSARRTQGTSAFIATATPLTRANGYGSDHVSDSGLQHFCAMVDDGDPLGSSPMAALAISIQSGLEPFCVVQRIRLWGYL